MCLTQIFPCENKLQGATMKRINTSLYINMISFLLDMLQLIFQQKIEDRENNSYKKKSRNIGAYTH